MLELVQFRHSPYNEKVRWALDRLRLAHVRRSVLPGPHLLSVKRLTGRTQTPVLVHDGGALDGSAAILAWLEERHPELAWLPAAPDERAEALRIQARFDDDLTPRIRRVVLDTLLSTPRCWAAVFAEARAPWQQTAYGLGIPVAAAVVRKANGIAGPASVEDGHRAIDEALALVARLRRGAFLVGNALSIADVTAAAALASVVGPPSSPMAFPEPMAPGFRALQDRYGGHPGMDWMRAVYAAHRGAATDFEGPSTYEG